MTFYVGQRVVCVDTSKPDIGKVFHGFRVSGDLDGLQDGKIYTIRGFHPVWTTGEPGVYLEEIKRRISSDDGKEVSFKASRFRPLIERSTETGMAILRKVADDAAARRNLVRLDQ